MLNDETFDYREDRNLKKNGHGYPDPTAYKGINKAEKPDRFHKLLYAIFNLCDLAGYDIVGRIVLRDKKTGRIWK